MTSRGGNRTLFSSEAGALLKCYAYRLDVLIFGIRPEKRRQGLARVPPIISLERARVELAITDVLPPAFAKV